MEVERASENAAQAGLCLLRLRWGANAANEKKIKSAYTPCQAAGKGGIGAMTVQTGLPKHSSGRGSDSGKNCNGRSAINQKALLAKEQRDQLMKNSEAAFAAAARDAKTATALRQQ